MSARVKYWPNCCVSNALLALNIVVLSLFFSLAVLANDEQTEQTLSQSNFVYTPEEMLDFDLTGYLEKNHPNLAKHTDVLSHWSGRSSVSPKVVIALFVKYPQLFDLSAPETVSKQIEELTVSLSEHYYKNLDLNLANPEVRSIEAVLAAKSKVDEKRQAKVNSKSYIDTFFELFPQERSALSIDRQGRSVSRTLPPHTLFQLPYPIGQSWQTWGGTHTFTGGGSGPFSSLDFRRSRVSFGADTSNLWVSSSSNGRVVKHSSCFVEVLGANGWSTTYYHLDNVLVNTGQSIARNTRLANYANTLSQSLCDGGSSNGPHLHFSLKRNGVYFSLDGVALSGYKVKSGRSNYDTDCNFFWLDNNGQKLCNGTPIRNNGVGTDSPPNPPTSGPDLVIESASIDVGAADVGKTVEATVNVANVGDVSAPATQLKFVVSSDSIISISDSTLAVQPLTMLSPASTNTITEVLTMPTTASQYWLGACVDSVNLEVNVNNNCSSALPIMIEKKPYVVAPNLLLLDE